VSLFATDDMSAAFDHVWVNVKQVALVGASGDQVVFDDPAGQIFDVKTLRDASGRRFKLLSDDNIPAGDYSGVKVVVSEAVNVFPTGAATATAATFDGSAGGSKTFALTFPAPKPLGSGQDLIIDFDLSRWTLTGTVVSADGDQFLGVVSDSTVDDENRHNFDDYSGVIGGLAGTAPTQTFTITRGDNTLTVQTNAATSVFNSSGAASPVLANGERVEVTGVFSTADNALTASTIKIEDDPAHDGDNEIRGAITAVSPGDMTVTVKPFRTDGFVPGSSLLTIHVGAGTQLFSDRGVVLTSDQFFAAATVGGFLEAQGTIAGDVLEAVKAKIESEGDEHNGGEGGGHHGGADVAGTASEINAETGTFVLTVSHWEGILLSNGAKLTVTTTGSTEYSVNGGESNKADFFAALASAMAPHNVVTIEGTYDDTTKSIEAKEIKLGHGDH